MVKQIGFLVDDLGPSQQSFFLIQSLNRWVEDPGNDAAIFCRTARPPCSVPAFPVFSLADFPGYSGLSVATSWACAEFLLGTQGPKRRAFYVQDLEWTRSPGEYEEWYRVYGSSLQMLCRGESHSQILARTWNRQFTIVPYFDIEKIVETLCHTG